MTGESNNRPPLIVKCQDSKTIGTKRDRENVRSRSTTTVRAGLRTTSPRT